MENRGELNSLIKTDRSSGMLVISVSAGGVFFSVRVGYKERNEESCTASLGFSLVGLNTLKLESELVLLTCSLQMKLPSVFSGLLRKCVHVG